LVEDAVGKKQSAALCYYHAHKILFVLGLAALIVSRGYKPFLGLIA
jgi:hypothetical protein